MEMKYPFLIAVGAVCCAVFLIFHLKKRKGHTLFDGGIKSAAAYYYADDDYFKKRERLYRLLSWLTTAALLTGIMGASVLLAMPHREQVYTEEKYSRDIMLCIDISTSVDYLNKNVVKELISTVENLKGERFGIVIFNTSPVLLSPLTDDYAYTIEQLKAIEKALAMRTNLQSPWNIPDDYLYYSEFISGGTLVGNQERGSSLIGDGLAATVFHFSKEDPDRTKVVIFTSDNDLQGEPLISLPEAAKLCRENDIVVYGVGTKEMYADNMKEMRASVESTGGRFYLEEESGSFQSIVRDIEKTSEALTEGRQYVVEKGYPRTWFLLLTGAVFVMLVCMKVSKR